MTLRFDSGCPTDLGRCAECLWVPGCPSGGLAGGARPPNFISGVRPLGLSSHRLRWGDPALPSRRDDHVGPSSSKTSLMFTGIRILYDFRVPQNICLLWTCFKHLKM